MHHLMSKPSLSIVGFSILCLEVGPHLTPFLPLLHVSICLYIVIVQVLFGQPHCYSILVIASLSLLGDSASQQISYSNVS